MAVTPKQLEEEIEEMHRNSLTPEQELAKKIEAFTDRKLRACYIPKYGQAIIKVDEIPYELRMSGIDRMSGIKELANSLHSLYGRDWDIKQETGSYKSRNDDDSYFDEYYEYFRFSKKA